MKGFGLKVTLRDKRVFLFQYWSPTLHRTRRRVTIGPYGPVTAEQARATAKQLAGQVAQGEDPGGADQQAKLAAKTATLEVLAAEYLAEIRPKKPPRTIESYESQFELHILPLLANRPVAHVTHTDIARLHSGLSDKPVTANRVVALLSAFMRCCERRGYRPRNTNPATDIEWFPEQSRERFLTVGRSGGAGAGTPNRRS